MNQLCRATDILGLSFELQEFTVCNCCSKRKNNMSEEKKPGLSRLNEVLHKKNCLQGF